MNVSFVCVCTHTHTHTHTHMPLSKQKRKTRFPRTILPEDSLIQAVDAWAHQLNDAQYLSLCNKA